MMAHEAKMSRELRIAVDDLIKKVKKSGMPRLQRLRLPCRSLMRTSYVVTTYTARSHKPSEIFTVEKRSLFLPHTEHNRSGRRGTGPGGRGGGERDRPSGSAGSRRGAGRGRSHRVARGSRRAAASETSSRQSRRGRRHRNVGVSPDRHGKDVRFRG